jgi:hypothetical protein
MIGLDQTIELIAQERPFGGCQWYFLCPAMGLPASVLWKPPGAKRFCSREAWGKQVAYKTQFVGQARRAEMGTARIRSRLGRDNKCPADAYLPLPKQRWMRWRTYDRIVEQYRRYEATVLEEMAACVEKLSAKLGLEIY